MVVAVVQWSRSAELLPGALAASCDGEGAERSVVMKTESDEMAP